jgi:hypothetical protein
VFSYAFDFAGYGQPAQGPQALRQDGRGPQAADHAARQPGRPGAFLPSPSRECQGISSWFLFAIREILVVILTHPSALFPRCWQADEPVVPVLETDAIQTITMIPETQDTQVNLPSDHDP